jgi:hypothetical protein
MSDQGLIDLFDRHLPFRLYVEHRSGVTVSDLAAITGLAQEWVKERIKAMRLWLEMQVHFGLAPHSPDREPFLQLRAA